LWIGPGSLTYSLLVAALAVVKTLAVVVVPVGT
jgi:hypothetical protein